MLKKLTFSTVNFFDNLSQRLLAIAAIIHLEIKKGHNIPLFVRLKALLNGFPSAYYQHISTSPKAHRKYYITEFDSRYRLQRINQNYGILLADKQVAYTFFHDYLVYLPKLFFHLNNGKFVENESGKNTPEGLTEVLRAEEKLIAKATRSYGGRDIHLLEYDSKQNEYLFDGEHMTKEGLVNHVLNLGGDFIVTEYVKQARYSSEIYPESVNTIRILTLYDAVSRECWIAGAAHRFGTKASGHVDNLTSGGIATKIDLATGELGYSLQNDQKTGVKKRIDRHPDTGTLITGAIVHNWAFIKEKILEMARYAFKNPYIGWDVVPTEKAFKIVEINDCPDIQLIQYFEPALLDERNRQFFAKYKIKPKRK